ncbi:MAG TPA: hypothetical protein DEO84_08350 [candidate division Zixibacteria bacterium]|jgi:hypothetical protein|nr:hypothetical protein [candidate division Zixibacteria bacterium]HBZ01311.1 hypothetical protein [candidate division Zixibacteria bacterium]
MKYIHINLRKFEIDIGSRPIDPQLGFFSIKTEGENPDYFYQHLSNKILIEIFYAQLHEYQRQSYSLLPPKAPKLKVAYKLSPPDPWLVSIASIIWQGIIQGLAWDLVKNSAINALSVLRKEKLVPKRWNYKKVMKSRKIGFVYEKYTDEEMLYNYFIGLKTSYEKEIRFSKNSLQEKDQHKIKKKQKNSYMRCSRPRLPDLIHTKGPKGAAHLIYFVKSLFISPSQSPHPK